MNNFFYPTTNELGTAIAKCFSRFLIRVSGSVPASQCEAIMKNIRISRDMVTFSVIVKSGQDVLLTKMITKQGSQLFNIDTADVSAVVEFTDNKELSGDVELRLLPSCLFMKSSAMKHEDLKLTVAYPFMATMAEDDIIISADIPDTETAIEEFEDAIVSINGIYPDDGLISIRTVGDTAIGFDRVTPEVREDGDQHE